MATKKMEEYTPSIEEVAVDWDEREDKIRERESKRLREENVRLLSELSEPFPQEVEKELRKGGAVLIYIPVSEVIARLNRVLGVMNWSSEIVRCERDALDPDFVVAHVRLTADTGHGYSYGRVTKDGFGGQKIKRTKNGDIVDLGDEFKGAVSDALKKAAQQFGVSLYLSRSEEALSIEEEYNSPPPPKVDPTIVALWDKFREASKDFAPEQKTALGEFWNTYSGNKPKPTLETATTQVLMALIEECAKIQFPGSGFTE